MNGYTNMDLDTYNCVENIFMSYNIKMESFEKNSKQIIKVLKQSDIVGADIFWNIINKCRNQKVKKKRLEKKL